MAESGSQELRSRVQAKQMLIPSTIRVVLALGILFAVRFVVVRLPGVATILLGPDVTIATILYSVLTLAMLGAILRYASSIGTGLNQIFDGFPEVERIVQLIGGLVVLAWGYQVFWWLPYFRENQVHYDYLFLISGLGLVGWVGYLLYSNIDKISILLSGKVVEDFDDNEFETREDKSVKTAGAGVVTKVSELMAGNESGEAQETEAAASNAETVGDQSKTADGVDAEVAATSTTSSESDDLQTCSECGNKLPEDAAFCNNCGADLTQDGT